MKELRRAKRLITTELLTVWTNLHIVALERMVPTGLEPALLLPSVVWAEYKSTLAGQLDEEEWPVLPLVYRNIEMVRGTFLLSAPGSAISPGRVQAIHELATQVRDAYMVLATDEQVALIAEMEQEMLAPPSDAGTAIGDAER